MLLVNTKVIIKQGIFCVGIWYNLRINEAKYDGENWETNLIQIRTSTCLFTQILNDRFQKKLDRLVKSPIILDHLDNLNDLINGDIVSIRRESKINSIINE